LKHNFIGTEHLLLGLLRQDESVAAHVLRHLNVKLDAARERVEFIVGKGDFSRVDLCVREPEKRMEGARLKEYAGG
jgi:ATP-dependent Clp protease ATP-binding subunit ClpA